jgi:hypothetical protein
LHKRRRTWRAAPRKVRSGLALCAASAAAVRLRISIHEHCSHACSRSGRAVVADVRRIEVLHGEWRSLVAHPAGGRAVAGSNPVSPIRFSLGAGDGRGPPRARRLALGSRNRLALGSRNREVSEPRRSVTAVGRLGLDRRRSRPRGYAWAVQEFPEVAWARLELLSSASAAIGSRRALGPASHSSSPSPTLRKHRQPSPAGSRAGVLAPPPCVRSSALWTTKQPPD